MRYLLFALLLVLVAGCCNKKECTEAGAPINIKLQGNSSLWQNAKLYKVNRTTNTIDSAMLNNLPDIAISEDLFDLPSGLGAYNYILATEGRRDTISDIVYVFSQSTVKCGACGGSGDDITVRHYNNFSYQYKGSSYGLNDTLVIDL